MKYFCSKDCPDLCEFEILKEGDNLKIEPISNLFDKVPFVCHKLKDFYKREISMATSSFIINYGNKKNVSPFLAATEFYTLLKSSKKILYLRGSGSLGYMLKYWDKFLSNFENTVFVEGNPCDETGVTAHMEDFGACINPCIENLKEVDSIIIFGRNAKYVSPHLYSYLKNLKKVGKNIIYIDPIKTDTAKLADLYLRINPATDGYLSAAILSNLKKIDIDTKKYSEITNISEENINYLSSLFYKGKVGIITGCGLQRYSNGMNIVKWINRLAVYTGNENYLYFSRSSKGKFEKMEMNINNKISITELPGIIESDNYDLVIIVASNPIVTFPNTNRWLDVLKNTKLIVVDTNYTETSKYSDIFIKVGGMFAQEDVMGSYFFNKESGREKFEAEVSDLDILRYLSDFSDINLDIKSINKLKPINNEGNRNFSNEKIEILPPLKNDRYEFRLLTNSSIYYLNSQVPDKFKDKENYIFISKEDADNKGYTDLQKVICKNEFGQIVSKIKISDKVSEGVLMIYKNRESLEGFSNMLNTNISTDSNNSFSLYDCFVDLVVYE
jgi:anaerobic selenocysteine-containing dehydrogenase